MCDRSVSWSVELARRVDEVVAKDGDPETIRDLLQALEAAIDIASVSCAGPEKYGGVDPPDPPADVGRAAGGLAAGAAVTAAGYPELTPIAAPLGAAAGEAAEREIRRRVGR